MPQEAETIGWTVRLEIHDGAEDAFRALADEAIQVTKKEEGTCMYEWFLDDDKVCTIRERFTGQKGAVAHLNGPAAQEVLPKLLEKSTLRALDVHGTPGPELAKLLESLPVSSTARPIGGFCRLAGADTATSELLTR